MINDITQHVQSFREGGEGVIEDSSDSLTQKVTQNLKR